MKPRNKFQKQVFELSKKLPSITQKQIEWAYQNSIVHYGYRTKNGVINCLECGNSWHSQHTLIDSICGSTCPNCQMELTIKDTRKRIFKDYQYFCIITTCKEFQVLRFFYVNYSAKAGKKAKYFHAEVVQIWIAPNGKFEFIAKLHSKTYFGDYWCFQTQLEIRPKRNHYNINPTCIYPHQRLIPELKRSGFTKNFCNLTPLDLFNILLMQNKAETLLKSGQTKLLHHFTQRDFEIISDYWASIKICIRNDYQITDAPLWCDYINLLMFFGKDLHNAKYVCPANLKSTHDEYVRKKREWQERLKRENAKKKALQDTTRYNEMKSRFFGITFTDGLIQVRMLDSVEDIKLEGDILHHCVFTNDYHLKPDSIILSASLHGQRIETIEFSLSRLQIIQCRGLQNKLTEYHDRIIKLVEKNVILIQKRLVA